MIVNPNPNRTKVVMWRCDKCGRDHILVAYHRSFGWYCRDCLTTIRDRLSDTIEAIDKCEEAINDSLGIDPAHPDEEK